MATTKKNVELLLANIRKVDALRRAALCSGDINEADEKELVEQVLKEVLHDVQNPYNDNERMDVDDYMRGVDIIAMMPFPVEVKELVGAVEC